MRGVATGNLLKNTMLTCLDNIGMQSQISILIKNIKDISNDDLSRLRNKIARSRSRDVMIYGLFYVRSNAFVVVKDEIIRRINNNIVIDVTTFGTVTYRRFLPKGL